MSFRDNTGESFDQKDQAEPSNEESDSQKDYHPGATCSELTESKDSIEKYPTLIESAEYDDSEYDSEVTLPPVNSPSLSSFYNDLSRSSRRYSCLPIQSDNIMNANPRNRAPSLPFFSLGQPRRHYPESNLKKLLFDNSRRSSFESAYQSIMSDRSSKSPLTTSILEDLDYSHEHRIMEDRRDSLSYEAIRSYFLEFNPYMNSNYPDLACAEHYNDPSRSLFCPFCHSRRSSLNLPNIHFRTSAHRQVVEHQFEDLLNIPNPRHSRSTSIDIFGGLGFPFTIPEQIDSLDHDGDEEGKDGGEDKPSDES